LAINENANIVDSGIDVGLPFLGNAPDIGAYEYDSSLANNESSIASINVYPNPTTGILNFSNYTSGSSYKIYTTTGILILSGNILASTIDLSALKNGYYYIKINDKKNRRNDIKKLIKK
jgi:hypothetical protein